MSYLVSRIVMGDRSVLPECVRGSCKPAGRHLLAGHSRRDDLPHWRGKSACLQIARPLLCCANHCPADHGPCAQLRLGDLWGIACKGYYGAQNDYTKIFNLGGRFGYFYYFGSGAGKREEASERWRGIGSFLKMEEVGIRGGRVGVQAPRGCLQEGGGGKLHIVLAETPTWQRSGKIFPIAQDICYTGLSGRNSVVYSGAFIRYILWTHANYTH